MAGGLRRAGDDLLVDVRLTPRADRDRIEGGRPLDDGATVLAARVRAAPEDGKANDALVRLVAATLHVPKTRVVIEAGAALRRKTLRIVDADAVIETAIAGLLDG